MSLNFLQNIETELGIIKVDINTVIGKVIAGVELGAHEADALLQWVLGQTSTIAAALNGAAPIIEAVTGLVTTAASGNPAAGQVAAAAVAGVNAAFQDAAKAVAAMTAASAALNMSKNAGNGSLVSDATAVMAGVQAVTGASKTVAALTNVAVLAAQTITNAMAAPVVTPAPVASAA